MESERRRHGPRGRVFRAHRVHQHPPDPDGDLAAYDDVPARRLRRSGHRRVQRAGAHRVRARARLHRPALQGYGARRHAVLAAMPHDGNTADAAAQDRPVPEQRPLLPRGQRAVRRAELGPGDGGATHPRKRLPPLCRPALSRRRTRLPGRCAARDRGLCRGDAHARRVHRAALRLFSVSPQARRRVELAIILVAATVATAAAGQPPPDGLSPRVRALLAQMTREEKLAVIRGTHEPEAAFMGQAGWIRGVPRLGIPDLRFADGPPGVLVRRASTGMPATLAMAATFSRAEAAANGAVIGRDARALGVDVILQPYINLYRDPTFERAYNTLGEDPVLTGTLAAQFVEAAQREGVMAQAKHFVAYDGADDAIVDGQTLREVYLAPFKAVVDAGVASVMCSYNRINGIYSCGNEATLKKVLRDEFGFRGFVTSDWGATHGAEFVARGLDMEQPGTGPGAFLALADEPEEKGMTSEEVDDLEEIMFFGVPEEQRYPVPARPESPPQPSEGVSAKLGQALARGSVVEADIDRAAGHVLGQLERFGWLDRAPRHAVAPQDIEANARIIQQTAERGAVLLKNDGALPLERADLESLALIGPGALQTFAIVTGQEQSFGRPEREVGAWQALRMLTKSEGLKLAVANDMTGVPVPSSALSDLRRIDGPSTTPMTDIDFTRRSGRALPAGTDIRWSGTLSVPAAGEYELDLQLLGATGKLGLGGKIIAQMGWWGGHGDIVFANRDNVIPTTDGLDNLRRSVKLSAGAHAISVEAKADGSGDPVQVRLAWVTPEMKARAYADAIESARSSKFAVVFGWSRNRPFFGLPGDQDRLIADVAAVNRNTIVVLNTGQPVAMPWLKDVRAVLEMWYTGDEGGWAAANLLTGKASPAGRLPITWPRRLEDGPANRSEERTSE